MVLQSFLEILVVWLSLWNITDRLELFCIINTMRVLFTSKFPMFCKRMLISSAAISSLHEFCIFFLPKIKRVTFMAVFVGLYCKRALMTLSVQPYIWIKGQGQWNGLYNVWFSDNMFSK